MTLKHWKRSAMVLGVALVLGACSKKTENTAPEASAPVEQGAVAQPPPVFYVTHASGPVAVYSLTDYSRLGDLPLGEGGPGADLSEDGKLLAVAMGKTNDLAIVDTATHQTIHRVPLDFNPGFVRVQGHLAFVGSQSTHAKTIEKAGGVSDALPSQVAIIDLVKGEKVKVIATGFNIGAIEPSANGEHILVTHDADENVSVHNIETGEKIVQVDTKEYGIRPREVKRSPNGEQFVITLEYGNKILILDKDYNVIRQAATGEVPHAVSYTRDGSEIAVGLARGKMIQVFDTETLALKREIPIAQRCRHFSFAPEDTHLIVACGPNNSLLVLDYVTGQLIKQIPESNSPWKVLIGQP
ncbi:MAG TPA: hypothetical protein VFV39_09755 [Limnobacter sp.]|nr:hypothetical protein [Limnobacter sp.]